MINYDHTRKVLSMLTDEVAAIVIMREMKDVGSPVRTAHIIGDHVNIIHQNGQTQLCYIRT